MSNLRTLTYVLVSAFALSVSTVDVANAQCKHYVYNPLLPTAQGTGGMDCVSIAMAAGTDGITGASLLTTANRVPVVNSAGELTQSDVALASGIFSRAGTLGLSATGSNNITLATNGVTRATVGVPTDSATLGSELVTNSMFATDLSGWTATNWTWASGALHTTGNTSPLSQSISVTSGQTYQVEITSTGGTAGSFVVTVGAVTVPGYEGSDNNWYNWMGSPIYRTFVAGATGTVTLAITPTSDWDKTITKISVKQITADSSQILSLVDGAESVAIQVRAVAALGNSFVGLNAGRRNTTGGYNTASGNVSLYSNTTGNYNTASGYASLYFNTTGSSNTASGYAALYSNTTGSNNVASGNVSLYYNTTGSHNVASGTYALYLNTTGSSNTASGYAALYSNTTGNYNTASGNVALYYNTTGSYNTASGYLTLHYNTTGGNNVASGSYALYYNTTGSNNVASGYHAGLNPSNDIAQYRITTDTNMTLVGYGATKDNASQLTNSTAIGNGAMVTKSNQVLLGNASVVETVLRGDVLLGGVSAGNYRLDVQSSGSSGTVRVYDQTAVTGVTQTIIRAGAGQSATALLNVVANDGTTSVFKLESAKVGFFGVTPVARAAALTAADANSLNTGDAASDTVIGNMRTRINELETKLQAYGLLQ